jgi:membrane protein implicated in regulation of membrane protease activity
MWCWQYIARLHKDHAMTVSTLWWIGAGVAVAVELATGTFYLLMIAIGLAAGAVAAHLGVGLPTQLVLSALVGGGAVAFWHLRRQRHPQAPAASANPDVNMDVGETVHIDHWQPDGTATVKYRGAQWAVMHRSGSLPTTGAHRVVEVVGSRLVVDKIP